MHSRRSLVSERHGPFSRIDDIGKQFLQIKVSAVFFLFLFFFENFNAGINKVSVKKTTSRWPLTLSIDALCLSLWGLNIFCLIVLVPRYYSIRKYYYTICTTGTIRWVIPFNFKITVIYCYCRIRIEFNVLVSADS